MEFAVKKVNRVGCENQGQPTQKCAKVALLITHPCARPRQRFLYFAAEEWHRAAKIAQHPIPVRANVPAGPVEIVRTIRGRGCAFAVPAV